MAEPVAASIRPRGEIPLPRSVSPEAQAMLARGPVGSMPPWPELHDTAAWEAVIDAMDAGASSVLQSGPATRRPVEQAASVVDVHIDDTVAYVATPAGVDEQHLDAVLYLHGGAWVQGAGPLCRAGAAPRAQIYGTGLWSVDYRMPPAHPFPAAHDDALAIYRHLLRDRAAHRIVIAGDSAGANIAAGLVLRIRDEGLPLPAGLVLDTPATDLTASGDTLATNEGLDTVLVGDFEPTMALYAGVADRRHPHLSPLFADFSAGFPPTLLLTGTRDRLLSDTVRMHRALHLAGIPVELHVFEAQGHGGFLGTAPEDAERAGEIRRFVRERLSAAAAQS